MESFYPNGVSHYIVGGVLIGLGLGLVYLMTGRIAGMCPGAALARLGAGNWPMFAGLGGMLRGAYLQGVLADK